MSIQRLLIALCGGLLAVSAVSAVAQGTETGAKKGCCASGAGKESCCTSACEHGSGRMKCSLTGKTMDTCCCVRKEGKLHCTLADKDVDTCCCQPIGEGEGGGAHEHHTEGHEPQE